MRKSVEIVRRRRGGRERRRGVEGGGWREMKEKEMKETERGSEGSEGSEGKQAGERERVAGPLTSFFHVGRCSLRETPEEPVSGIAKISMWSLTQIIVMSV